MTHTSETERLAATCRGFCESHTETRTSSSHLTTLASDEDNPLYSCCSWYYSAFLIPLQILLLLHPSHLRVTESFLPFKQFFFVVVVVAVVTVVIILLVVLGDCYSEW